MASNVELLRAAHDSWNRRDFEGVIRNLAERATYTDHASGRTLKGKNEIRNWTESWARALPDGKILNPVYIDAGDIVVTQFIGEGTNTGMFNGLPPSGRRVSFSFCEVWHFDRSGRMVSGEAYYDQYSLLTQMGHLKPLAVGAAA